MCSLFRDNSLKGLNTQYFSNSEIASLTKSGSTFHGLTSRRLPHQETYTHVHILPDSYACPAGMIANTVTYICLDSSE